MTRLKTRSLLALMIEASQTSTDLCLGITVAVAMLFSLCSMSLQVHAHIAREAVRPVRLLATLCPPAIQVMKCTTNCASWDSLVGLTYDYEGKLSVQRGPKPIGTRQRVWTSDEVLKALTTVSLGT